ncbi:peptide deformylase [Peptoniphilus catoniae]|uniref:peptide deformylase n=1 Tax=Peptoniphilus catoniae TaxID=1660341 RepID=UPI0010FEDC32|nr:peptide deformylase [Peptoniphilus catoniae]
MALRTIRTDKDPILRKKSRQVTKFDDRLKILIEDMYETMDKAEGVGLAAPQVGILKRVIVVDNREDIRMALINPEITEKDGSEVAYEACLSIPERQGTVERATHIELSYIDENFEEKTMEASDFFARILQHEIDHLDGVLYSDRAIEMYTIKDKEVSEE